MDSSPYIPKKVVDGDQTFKAKEEWTNHDKKIEPFNNKTMHILFYALIKTQFKKV